MQLIDRIVNTWWFGDAIVLLICGAVVTAAAILTPTDDAVSLFGVEIPAMCTWRQLFGVGCPGCGLTRSFTFMAHGAVFDAFRMNWLGPLLFSVVAVQLPLRVIRLTRGRPDREVAPPAAP